MPEEIRDGAERTGDTSRTGAPASDVAPGRAHVVRATIPAPVLAQAVTMAILAGYGTVTLLNVIRSGVRGMPLLGCAALVVAVFGLQCAVSSPLVRHWGAGQISAVLLPMTALSYLPVLALGLNWGSMQGPLAGALLLLLPPKAAWPLAAVVVASVTLYAAEVQSSWPLTGYYAVATMLTGLVIFALSRLNELVREVHATRAQLARMAVGQERLRFARDLHDLLGYSLSAITLKGELISRLLTVRPPAARRETAELLLIARQALADVRLVSRGYRDMSLRDEATSAAAVLTAAGIRAEVDIELGRLHPVADTVLATTLREGVTNILRHSTVSDCEIRAVTVGESILLTLVNDGARAAEADAPAGPPSGTGLNNLRDRAAEIGGSLTAGLREDGRFELTASVPATPRRKEAAPEEEDYESTA